MIIVIKPSYAYELRVQITGEKEDEVLAIARGTTTFKNDNAFDFLSSTISKFEHETQAHLALVLAMLKPALDQRRLDKECFEDTMGACVRYEDYNTQELILINIYQGVHSSTDAMVIDTSGHKPSYRVVYNHKHNDFYFISADREAVDDTKDEVLAAAKAAVIDVMKGNCDSTGKLTIDEEQARFIIINTLNCCFGHACSINLKIV